MGVGPNLNVKPPFAPPTGPPPPQNNNLQQGQPQGGAPVPPIPPAPPPPPAPPTGGNENSDTKSQNHQNSAVNQPTKGLVPGGRAGYANNHGSNSSKPNSDNATMPKRPRKTSGGVLGFGMSPKNAQGNMSSIDTVSYLFFYHF